MAFLSNLIGNRTMSSLCDQLLLHLGHQDLPGGASNNCLITTESEVLCLAMCNQARLHGEQGMYAAALDIIQLAKERFPMPSKHAKVRVHHSYQCNHWFQGGEVDALALSI